MTSEDGQSDHGSWSEDSAIAEEQAKMSLISDLIAEIVQSPSEEDTIKNCDELSKILEQEEANYQTSAPDPVTNTREEHAIGYLVGTIIENGMDLFFLRYWSTYRDPK
eukprot:Rmarinus@m.1687